VSYTVAVTGHRPGKLWGYNLADKRYQAMKNLFKEELVKRSTTDAYSGMALGVDTVFALSVLELKDQGYKIKLHCAIPCQNHSCKWVLESQEQYNAILSRADEVVVVTDRPYAPYLMQIRNQYMVDRADEVLAVWDGTSGGTANCVRYAQRIERPVTIINTQVFEI